MAYTRTRATGISAALLSAVCLGVAPVLGKVALRYGFTPLAVVAVRTTLAAVMMMLMMLIFNRKFFYIYPVGLIGCVLAGFINGLGSILYYSALSRMDAGLGHMLYSFYPIFVALWLLIDRQSITPLTLFRLALSIPGIYLLVSFGKQQVDWLGAGLMLGSAALYALHLIINQRVLFEVPAPTVTLYTLISMGLTVLVSFLIFDRQFPPASTHTTWYPLIGMAFFTFLSRVSLFTGVKHLGGLQTAMLGLAEVFVTVLIAIFWLGESLTIPQWLGALLLAACLLLVGFDRYTPEKRNTTGWLSWLNPPQMPTSDFPWKPN